MYFVLFDSNQKYANNYNLHSIDQLVDELSLGIDPTSSNYSWNITEENTEFSEENTKFKFYFQDINK